MPRQSTQQLWCCSCRHARKLHETVWWTVGGKIQKYERTNSGVKHSRRCRYLWGCTERQSNWCTEFAKRWLTSDHRVVQIQSWFFFFRSTLASFTTQSNDNHDSVMVHAQQFWWTSLHVLQHSPGTDWSAAANVQPAAPQTTTEHSLTLTGGNGGEGCSWKLSSSASVQARENFMAHRSRQRTGELIFTLADSSFLAGSFSDILLSLICAAFFLTVTQTTKENKNILYLYTLCQQHKQ